MLTISRCFALIALLIGSPAVLADCRTNIWKDYHQYFTKGTMNSISFKLKDISSTTVWIHCLAGKPDVTWSDNAICKKGHENNNGKTISYYCKYTKATSTPCIKLKIQCQ